MELWLVRHGQTDWNVEKRMQGWRDVPLNAVGRRQAQILADTLRGQQFSHIYTSDLARARCTAEILQDALQCALSIEPLLRERRFGPREGTIRGHAAAGQIQTTAFPSIDSGLRDEEPEEVFAGRAASFLRKVGASSHQRRVMAVTHGGFVRITLRVLGRTPPEATHNTGVTRLYFDGQTWHVVDVDQAVHLLMQGQSRFSDMLESDVDP